MGMDVYGLSPTIRINTKKPERPKDLHEGASDEVIKKYFAQQFTNAIKQLFLIRCVSF